MSQQGWPNGGDGLPPEGVPRDGEYPTEAVPPVGEGWPAASGGTAPESATPGGWGATQEMPPASGGWAASGGWEGSGGATQQFPAAQGEPYSPFAGQGGAGTSGYGAGAGDYGSGSASPYTSQQTYSSYPAGGYSSQPPGGYGGGGYGGPGGPGGPGGQPGKSGAIWWIVGGVVVLAGIVVAILFLTGILGGGAKDDPTASVSTTPVPTTTEPLSVATTPESTPSTGFGPGAAAPGTDAELDAFWNSCAAGDMEACDNLYWNSPLNSVYEEYAISCGGTQSGRYGSCATLDGNTLPTFGLAPGTDATLDALWNSCAGGDMAACDDLYWSSPVGSEYEDFAISCGGTQTDMYGSCDTSGGSSSTGNGYGSDATLDALWDSCEGGDMAACDELYWTSPLLSEYESFGQTCGGREAEGHGQWCDPASASLYN